jgi:hypothetical protein
MTSQGQRSANTDKNSSLPRSSAIDRRTVKNRNAATINTIAILMNRRSHFFVGDSSAFFFFVSPAGVVIEDLFLGKRKTGRAFCRTDAAGVEPTRVMR